MNEAIAKLYEIEEKAGQILEEAKHRQVKMQNQMEVEQKLYEKNLRQEMQDNLIKVREEMELYAKQEQESLEKRYHEQMEELDEKYDSHLDELAQEIFERIIEV